MLRWSSDTLCVRFRRSNTRFTPNPHSTCRTHPRRLCPLHRRSASRVEGSLNLARMLRLTGKPIARDQPTKPPTEFINRFRDISDIGFLWFSHTSHPRSSPAASSAATPSPSSAAHQDWAATTTSAADVPSLDPPTLRGTPRWTSVTSRRAYPEPCAQRTPLNDFTSLPRCPALHNSSTSNALCSKISTSFCRRRCSHSAADFMP